MAAPRSISQDRASRIAKALACPHCQEYSFKRMSVKRAPASHKDSLKTLWVVQRTCGVCGLEQELGIDAEGEVAYSS